MPYLDECSRRTVRTCLVRSCLMTSYVFALWSLGCVSVVKGCEVLSAAFSFVALLDIIVAIQKREPTGHSSLNIWDEALTFNGLALIVHILQRI